MRPLLFLGLAAGFVLSASAQPGWQPTPDGARVSIRATYAAGNDVPLTDDLGNQLGEVSANFGLILLDAQVPLGDRVRLVGTVPVALSRYTSPGELVGDEFGLSSSVDLANPYVGVAVRAAPSLVVEGGVWLPLAGARVSLAVFETERLRFETSEAYYFFFPDREADRIGHVAGRLAVRGEMPLASIGRLRGEVAPVLTVLTEDPMRTGPDDGPIESPRTDLSFTSRLLTDARLGRVTLTAGVEGRYEPDTGFNVYLENIFADGLAAVSVEGLAVRPSAFVRLPLRGGGDPGLSVGVGFSVPFR